MADDSTQAPQGVEDSTALSDIATNGNLLNQNISALITAVDGLSSIVLPVSKGGTGRDSLTAHNVLIGAGIDPVNFVAPTSNSGAALVGQGASSDPIFGKVVLTQPATLSTLTISDGKTLAATKSVTLAGGDGSTIAVAANKTLTASNSLTLAGTDSTTMTFPASSANVAALNLADQSLSGGANVTSKSLTTGSITIDCGACPLQYITNGGAFTITAPSNDGSCILLVTNNASAGSITFSGFSVGSNTGDSLTTTNGNKFFITIVRINGTSTYAIKAAQ
jgi:hypothetical protein